MTPAATYVRRFTRIQDAFEVLADHPQGLPLERLAQTLGATTAELREEILAFYTAEAAVDSPLLQYRDPGMQFVSAAGDEADPLEADIVVVTGEPLADLGIDRLTHAQMAELWRTGRALLTLEPDNTALAAALDVIADGWLLGTGPDVPDPGDDWVAALRAAVEERRVVRIEYSRAWRPGVFERAIHPYRVVAGGRGWEVDAGPLDDSGRPRAYLLGNVRSLTPTPEHFEVPAGAAEAIQRNRATTAVTMVLPQDAAWAPDRLAESVALGASDSDDVTVHLDLVEPVAQRVGLILLAAQGRGFVVDPPDLADAGAVMAQRLLAHHDLQLP